MTRLVGSLTTPARDRTDWLSRIVGLGLLVGLGVVLGQQYLAPDSRVIGVLVAVLVLGLAWRIDTTSGLGLLLVILPYPRATIFGTTTLAFILLLMIVWLLRVSQRHSDAPHRTPVDAPLVGLFVAYVVSFYNVQKIDHLYGALANFISLLACFAMLYLMVHNVKTEEQLRRLHRFQLASVIAICVLGVWEMVRPGATVIPGWIQFIRISGSEINPRNQRIGGPFFDFELLSEWCGITLLLVVFWLVRARSVAERALHTVLALVVTLLMFATVTRGAFISLVVAMLYMAWLLRRRIRFIPLVTVTAVIAVVFAATNFFVANFTHSGDLFERFRDPQSLRFAGALPESRASLWISAFHRMMEKPIFGHGPYYVIQGTVGWFYWPHNGYLFLGYLVGFFGLTFFFWFLWRLWRMSYLRDVDLVHDDYATAFLAVANVQLVFFMVDQLKIDYLRNPIYTYQVWVLFASIVTAYRVAHAGARSSRPVAALARAQSTPLAATLASRRP
jgi:uncharacterized protein YacL